jgi:hypothetical protein
VPVPVEVVGLPVGYAAAAGSPHRGPVHVAGRIRRGDLREVLRGVPATAQLVLIVASADLPEVLGAAGDHRGTTTGSVLAEPVWARERVTWGPLAALPGAIRDRTDVVCCLDGTGQRSGPDEALLAALAAQGVSARTLALALADLPGWSRRRAYEVVHRVGKA